MTHVFVWTPGDIYGLAAEIIEEFGDNDKQMARAIKTLVQQAMEGMDL